MNDVSSSMHEFAKMTGIKLGSFIAGLVGAMMALFYGRRVSSGKGIVMLIVAALFATYGGEFFASIGVGEAGQRLIVLFGGLTSMSVSYTVLDWIDRKRGVNRHSEDRVRHMEENEVKIKELEDRMWKLIDENKRLRKENEGR